MTERDDQISWAGPRPADRLEPVWDDRGEGIGVVETTGRRLHPVNAWVGADGRLHARQYGGRHPWPPQIHDHPHDAERWVQRRTSVCRGD